ncbi:MAG: hypothetical protein M1820_010779 [Bogoriella megaspora]|nr:MAG: hypothetical protein M1820_010779 [Bogoriella megaspora]
MELFPPEILSIVCEFSSRETLSSLSLCNRKFYHLSAPSLYANIVLRTTDKWYCGTNVKRLRGFRSLTCLMVRSPWIARHVRHLEVRDSSFVDNPSNQIRCQLEPELRKAIGEAAQSYQERDQWLENASDPRIETCLMSIFLAQLVNLESLFWEAPTIEPNHTFRQMTRMGIKAHPYDRTPALGKLRRVLITQCGRNYFLEPEATAWILGLPSVQEMYIHTAAKCVWGAELHTFALMPQRSSHCKVIDIRNSMLGPQEFSEMLSCCQGLETLCFEAGRRWWLGQGDSAWRGIRRALDTHRTTLRNLRLKYLEDNATTRAADSLYRLSNSLGEAEPAGSLTEFTALERIEIDSIFLSEFSPMDVVDWDGLLVQVFPSQIKYLKITHTEEAPQVSFKGLVRLLEQRHMRTPKLDTLVIQCDSGLIVQNEGHVERLSSLAKSQGVVLRVESYFRSQKTSDEEDGLSVERKWGFDDDVEWPPCKNNMNKWGFVEEHDLH